MNFLRKILNPIHKVPFSNIINKNNETSIYINVPQIDMEKLDISLSENKDELFVMYHSNYEDIKKYSKVEFDYYDFDLLFQLNKKVSGNIQKKYEKGMLIIKVHYNEK